MGKIWAGIDACKTHHHRVVVDNEGRKLLSRRVPNDEPELLALLTEVAALDDEATWAIDLADGGAALLITVLARYDQRLLYIPGRTVNSASTSYRGKGKTDARDALVIADQARMRRDLNLLRPHDEATIELKVLTGRRADLVCDRTRAVNRLRGVLTSMFPALERTLELTNAGPLTLLTAYQSPAALRRLGAARLQAWLRNRKVRNAAALAKAAVDAAERQHTVVTGEKAIAKMVGTLAREVIALNMTFFANPDRLAGFAGLAPAPRDSGRISGNLHRPKRYHRGLQRVFYTSALISIRCCPESRRFYDRKRAEGKRHTQAVLALARRRVNVLWALLRDIVKTCGSAAQTSTSNSPGQPSWFDCQVELGLPASASSFTSDRNLSLGQPTYS